MPENDPHSLALSDLSQRLDLVAGAVASIAASHTDLLTHVAEAEARRSADSREAGQRLNGVEQALLAVPVTSSMGPGSYVAGPTSPALADLQADVALSIEVLARVAEIVDRLDQHHLERAEPAVDADAFAKTADDLGTRLTLHTDAALAGAVRLIDGRLAVLREELQDTTGSHTPVSQSAGFEAGAVMGAAQAAWNRLEQRLDTEFDDLGRRLDGLAGLVQAAAASAEAAASRPVVSGEQIRHAATSVKATVVDASRAVWARRGQRSLGSGR